MQRVLLNCKSIEQARFLTQYLETQLKVSVVSTKESGTGALLIMQTGSTASEDLLYVQSLRRLGFQQPVLAITDRLGTVNIAASGDEHRTYFLEAPFELKSLVGLTRKLMLTREVAWQSNRRYPTSLSATVETFESGETYDSQMLNLSKGGAYFESASKPPIVVGDLLRLRVYLADMERDHYVHGRVVWMTSKGSSTGGYGWGVKFLKFNDIYRQWLNKI